MSNKMVTQDRPKGSWGRLQHFPFFLKCPAHHLSKFHLVDPRPCWSVNISESEEVLARFAQCGLPGDFLDAIKKPENQTKQGDQIIYFPPEEGVLTLTPEIRATVYLELSRFPANKNIVGPCLIPKDQFDTWFVNTSLRPELIKLIKQMSYQRGDALAFSDQSFLTRFLTGEDEAREVLSILTRTPALMLQLVLDKKSKISDIASYWSTGEARRTLPNHAPLLKVLQGAGDTEILDVVHLLPPLPRKLLYTYLDPSYFAEGEVPDCHWSSLNFFKHREEPFFLHSHFATTAVLERYQPVKPPYRFGDILAFVHNPEGNAYHSCVYIADDVVFTKNGRNILSPWVFQSLAYVKMTYLFHNNGRIVGYRPRSF